MLLAIVLAATVIPQPAPSSTPLTIMTVKASPVCDTLHQSVAPAIVAFRTDDYHFEIGATELLNASYYESVSSYGKVGLEMMRLETEEDQLAQNIIKIDTLLADPRFANSHNAQLAAIKQQLEAVLQYQKNALNVISGTVESYGNGLLGGAAYLQMVYPSRSPAVPIPDTPQPTPTTTPTTTPTPNPASIAADSALERAIHRLTDFSSRTYRKLAREIGRQEFLAQQPDENAARLIVALNQSCK